VGFHSGHQNTSGTENTFLGFKAGFSNTDAHNNIFIGHQAGFNTTAGWDNLFLGYQSGFNNTITGKNTYLGYETGFLNNAGEFNVFLGFKAGYNEMGSNKLYISNSDTDKPLIYGEFDNKIVTINDILKLAPSAEPVSAEEGMIYFDDATKVLRVFDGTNWHDLW
jgi:hypothetical protein